MSLTQTLCLLSTAALAGDPNPATDPGRSGVEAAGTHAFHDYDADGLLDLLALEPGGAVRLLRNAGQAGFEDATAAAGLTGVAGARAVLWHDVDGDGPADLTLLTVGGGARLFYGSLEGLFAEGTEGSGLEHAAGVASARWIDLDLDGRADLFTTTNAGERLWHNLGDGSFRELALPLEPPGEGAGSEGLVTTGGGVESASAGTGGYTIDPQPGNPVGPYCGYSVRDTSSGLCLLASSFPEMGKLYPLSPDFMVSPNGNVGIGIGTPSKKLQVQGEVWAVSDVTGRSFVSTVADGTPPLSVGSTTTVPNLSADSLDGLDSAVFTQLGQSIEGTEITDGSVTFSDIAVGAVTSSRVADESLTAVDIAAGAIGTSEVADGSLTGADIQDESIDGADINFATITGYNIQDFSLTNGDISSAAAISGTKINADFGSQDVTTSGRMGAGTSAPTADLHVLGDATRGLILVAPDQSVGSGDADLFLAEDDDGSFGFRIRYQGINNDLEFRGKNAGGDTIHMSMDRDSGNVGIGSVVAPDRLKVIGTDQVAIYGASVGTNSSTGVFGTSTGASSAAIEGVNNYLGVGVPVGVQGQANSPLGWGVRAVGNFTASGIKAFVQPHPQDPARELRFVCLEGNESGTYFRGSSRLIGGEAIIDVPEDFRLVTDPEALTVQVTAMGLPAALYVVSKDLDRIVVRGAGGAGNVDFDYFVNGVRRGFSDFETEAPNSSFIPTERGVPYGTQYPDDFRRILVQSGILNPDFTPNEATAAAQGWELRDPAPAAGAVPRATSGD